MWVDLPYRATLAVWFIVALAVARAFRAPADGEGGLVPRSADGPLIAAALGAAGLVFYGSLLLWLLHPPLVAWAGLDLPAGWRWAGAALATAGLGLAAWTLAHLGHNVTPTSAVRGDARLVDTGPYRWVRHPLYSSLLLTGPALALLTANLLVLAGAAAIFAVLAVRTRREEAALRRAFGPPYEAYSERTGRFLPRTGQKWQ